MTTDQQPTGQQLRDAGIDAVLDADAAVHRGYREAIEAALDGLAASGIEFTADDVAERLPQDVRDHAAPSLVSAVFSVYSRQKRIECVGLGTSSRRSRHAGAVRRWIGATSPPHAA